MARGPRAARPTSRSAGGSAQIRPAGAGGEGAEPRPGPGQRAQHLDVGRARRAAPTARRPTGRCAGPRPPARHRQVRPEHPARYAPLGQRRGQRNQGQHVLLARHPGEQHRPGLGVRRSRPRRRARPNTPATHSLSWCSISTPVPVCSHRSAIAFSTGRTTSSQVASTPIAATASASSARTGRRVQHQRGPGQPVRAAAGRRQPQRDAADPDLACRRSRVRRRRRPGEVRSVEHRRRCRSERLGSDDGVERVASRAASAGDAPRTSACCISSSRATSSARVAPVPARGVLGGPEPVAPVPGAQRRRRDPEPAGGRGHAELRAGPSGRVRRDRIGRHRFRLHGFIVLVLAAERQPG